MSSYSCADRNWRFDVLQLMKEVKRRHEEAIVWLGPSAIDLGVGHRELGDDDEVKHKTRTTHKLSLTMTWEVNRLPRLRRVRCV